MVTKLNTQKTFSAKDTSESYFYHKKLAQRKTSLLGRTTLSGDAWEKRRIELVIGSMFPFRLEWHINNISFPV